MRRLPILLCVLVTIAATQPVLGASGLNVQSFRPSPHTRDYFSVQGTETVGHLEWGVNLFMNYASNPLLTRRDSGEVFRHVVTDQITGDLQFNIGVLDFMEFALDFPLYPYIAGDGIAPGQEPSTGGAGDLRLYSRFRILNHNGNGFGLAASAILTFPIGKHVDEYMGSQNVTFSPQIMAEYRNALLRVAFDLGFRFGEPASFGNLDIGQELYYGVGFGIKPATEFVEIIVEGNGTANMADPLASNERQLEAIGGLKIFPMAGMTISTGAGAGILSGYGTPQWRVFAGIGYMPTADKDTDGDGILDKNDRCPTQPEDPDGFEDQDGCPDPDNDNDGIPDITDKCPLQPEDADAFQDEDGCPDLDNDGDGIPDVEDKCRNEPEDKDGFQDEDGCPDPDNDGDGILDKDDKCPIKPENINGCQDEDGCPEEGLVCVTPKKLVILQPIFFQFGKAQILERSMPVLEEMARVLNDNPQLLKVRIEGHTDDVGPDWFNLRLSQMRAKAVNDVLVKRNVDPKRLVFRGFGESEPLVPNTTEMNRAQNRRVEFIILDRAAE